MIGVFCVFEWSSVMRCRMAAYWHGNLFLIGDFMLELCVVLFVLLNLFVILFQVALAFGAPWGEFTLGGKWRGRLPPRVRVIPIISAILISVFVAIVLARVGMAFTEFSVASRRWIWLVVAYCLLGMVANATTPSRLERRLWFPIVSLMFVLSLTIALNAPN